MEHSQYDDALISFAEIDTVRETSCDGFANVAVQHGELFWCSGYALNQELDFDHEFDSESGAFFLIPVARFVKLGSSLLAENDREHYRCQRA